MANRLTRYTLGGSLRWRWNPDELPGGETAGSIVSKAIEGLYSSESNWNPDQEPNLEKYLQRVIDTFLNHLAVSEALSKLGDKELREMILRLTRYALSVSRRLRWRTRNPEDLPGGETVGSIVSKAIVKLCSGERSWKPDEEPNLEKYLQGVIDSLLNHLAESEDNVRVLPPPEPGSNDFLAWERGSVKREPEADWLLHPPPSPEAVLSKAEENAEQSDMETRALELLLSECQGDSALLTVVKAMMDGHSTPAEISAATSTPVTAVYNAIKRLDRKLEVVRQSVADGKDGSSNRRKTL